MSWSDAGCGVTKSDGAPHAAWRQQDLQQLPTHLLPLGLGAELLPIAARLLAGKRLGEMTRIECGIAASGFGRAVGRGPERILRSGDIRPFALASPARFDARAAGLQASRLARMRVAKIVVPGMFRRLCAAADPDGRLLGRVYFIPLGSASPDERALLLGLLNSRLYALLYAGLFAAVAQSGGWLRANAPYLGCLPWPARQPGAALRAAVEALESRQGQGDREDLEARIEALFGLSRAERGILARLAEGLAPAGQTPDVAA